MKNKWIYWLIGITLFLIILNGLGVIDLGLFSSVGSENPIPSSHFSSFGGLK